MISQVFIIFLLSHLIATVFTQFRTQFTDLQVPECIQSNGKRGKCYRYDECGRFHRRTSKFDICEFSLDLRFMSVCCDELPPSRYNVLQADDTWSVNSDFECGVRLANRDMMEVLAGKADPNDEAYALVQALTLLASRDGTHPWMVSVWYKTRQLCGGSIINRKTILTSAHCFKLSRDPNDYSVTMGSINLGQGLRMAVKRLIIHPNYRPPSIYNDVALIALEEKIKFDWRLNAVCLSSKFIADPMLSAQKATVIGFGDTTYHGQGSKVLQETTVPMVGSTECTQVYRKFRTHFPQGLTNEFICAGYPEGGKDSCLGDSGGPLTIKHYSKTMQIGIVTYGHGCAFPGFPGVYINVAYHYRWIKESIESIA